MSYYQEHLRRQREEHERMLERHRAALMRHYTHEQKVAIAAAFFSIDEKEKKCEPLNK
jgi:hypothetical protein